MPAGVCNVLTGPSGPMGGELTANPLVRKLSFTGSTEVGANCSPCARPPSRRPHGTGRQRAVHRVRRRRPRRRGRRRDGQQIRNTGQTCVCANRLLVQDGVYDAFAAKLKAAVEAMKVGNGMEPGRQPGPADQRGRRRQGRGTYRRRLKRGASIVTGGHRHALGGTFFEPTVLANVPAEALIFREETFGPVAPFFRFKTEEEAIRMANDTQFGLASYFYARDVGRIFRVAEALEYGIVGINEGIISTAEAPVRRRQAVRSGARGIQIRHRGLSRGEISRFGRHRHLIAARPPRRRA